MNKKVFNLVLTALYAGLIFISISILRVHLVYNFVHPGNALVALSPLLLKRNNALIAAGLGVFLFDLANGYLSGSLLIVLEAIIIVLTVDFIFTKLFKSDDSLKNIIVIAISAASLKVCLVFIKYFITQLVLGSVFETSLAYAGSKMPASLFTALITITLVPILYYPLNKIMGKYK